MVALFWLVIKIYLIFFVVVFEQNVSISLIACMIVIK